MTHKQQNQTNFRVSLLPILQRLAFQSKFDLVFNSAIYQCHLSYWGLHIHVVDNGPSLRKDRVYQKHVRLKNEDEINEMYYWPLLNIRIFDSGFISS